MTPSAHNDRTSHDGPRLSREADGPRTYEGRPLADQGLRFDLGTLISGRRSLAVLGAGAATIGLAACGAADGATTTTTTSSATSTNTGADTATDEIPDETNGPYPGDGSNGPDVLTESGVVRQDIRSSFGTGSATASGVPMTLELTLTDLSCSGAAYEGAAVYIWHCTADGQYSMYADGLESENYLRGVQIADADGKVSFTSILPGCYSGRWPHIHVEVYPDEASITSTDNLLATSQVALPQAVCEEVYATDGYDGSQENLSRITLASDNVFGDDGGELQLADTDGDVPSRYAITLPVAIDPTTEAGAGGGMGAPPPGGQAPGDRTGTSLVGSR